jgi:DNA-binding NarL/FixJ family response regulator
LVTPVPFAYRPPTPISTPKLRRILIVQSDAIFGGILWEALTKAGFGAHLTASRADASSVSTELRPDIVIADLELPDDGLPLIEEFSRRRPSIPTIVVTAVADEGRILTAIRAGAVGYVFKDDVGQRAVAIVEEAMRGGTPLSRSVARLLLRTFRGEEPKVSTRVDLTPREQGVLGMLARGKSYAEVGATLGVSENTVRSHVRSIYEKLGASSKTEAVMIGLRLGLLRVDQ